MLSDTITSFNSASCVECLSRGVGGSRGLELHWFLLGCVSVFRGRGGEKQNPQQAHK